MSEVADMANHKGGGMNKVTDMVYSTTRFAESVSWGLIETCIKEEHGYNDPVLLLIEPYDIAYVGFWGKSAPHDSSKEAWRLKWNHEAPVDRDSGWEPTHWLPLPKWIPAKI